MSSRILGNGFVQWKGTDVCLDFTCLCGTGLHFDGDFAYALRCWSCERIWELPSYIPMKLVTEGEAPHTIQDTCPYEPVRVSAFVPYDPDIISVDDRRQP